MKQNLLRRGCNYTAACDPQNSFDEFDRHCITIGYVAAADFESEFSSNSVWFASGSELGIGEVK